MLKVILLHAGSDLMGAEGARDTPHPFPYFFQEKNKLEQKIQKHNINKIYQIESRLKEIICLTTIAETKNTFSAVQILP